MALLGPTSYEWIVAYFGTVNSGGVAVPIDKELPAADICDELNRADVEVLVYDSKLCGYCRAGAERLPAGYDLF